MPKLKRKACAANLGMFSQKKQRTDTTTSDSPRHSPRSLSPISVDSEHLDPNDFTLNCPSDDGSSVLSELSEELDDVPAFESEQSLLKWLQLGKEQIKKLVRNLKPTEKRGRGPYFKSTIGRVPSDRTVRLKKAEDKKKAAGHGKGLMGWLGRPGTAPAPAAEVAPEPESTVAPLPEETGETPLIPPSDAAVDHESIDVDLVVVADNDDGRSLSPSEQEEEGLGDLEEIFAKITLAPETPCPPHNPAPPVPGQTLSPSPVVQSPAEGGSSPNQQYTAGPIPFTRGDQSFRYTPVMQPAGPPSRPPLSQKVEQAIVKLNAILHPSRGPNTKGYKNVEMNMVLHARLELMISFLRLYASGGCTEWAKSADIIAKSAGKGSWLSRRIREWAVDFIRDEENLPTAEYGKMNASILEDEDLAQELHLHLQGLGKYVAAQDIVDYMGTDEMKARLKLKNGISLRTAQRWMQRMEYRWTKEPKGMYSDGHEREDVVDYRQNRFLPRWAELSKYTRKYTEDGDEIGSPEAAAAKAVPKQKKKSKQRAMEEIDEVWDNEEMERTFVAAPDGRVVVIWRHDECIFYANDRRKIRWVHSGEKAKPSPVDLMNSFRSWDIPGDFDAFPTRFRHWQLPRTLKHLRFPTSTGLAAEISANYGMF
ncbi:hypothetical protein MSAN_01637300 [Mycena sanguinolenta]|uniref:Uncharacterized protein n=1 Tax=Mycena sanguinolenta TaxID=230812 RepID=A0A8H6Y136_9AGAR|nr:hypothetical protein MSAN_01637300 [Mycena sanguinolenta]